MTVETTAAADRGDDFTPEVAPTIDLNSEDLAAIGRTPEKDEAAEPVETKEADEKEPEKKEPESKDEPAAEKKEEEKAEKKPIMIPKARFDELNQKSKDRIARLERQLEDMKTRAGQVDAAPDVSEIETKLEAKSEEYTKLIIDGDTDKAKQVMIEINRLNRQLGVVEATTLSNSHATETQHMDALGSLVEMYTEMFPVFDAGNKDTYRQDYVDFVARLQGGFERGGDSPAEALRQAVEMAVIKYGLTSEIEPEKKAEEKPDKGKERTRAAIDKALKAAGAQPSRMEKAGSDSDAAGVTKININELSMAEFDKLSEAAKQRLRGDIVTTK